MIKAGTVYNVMLELVVLITKNAGLQYSQTNFTFILKVFHVNCTTC